MMILVLTQRAQRVSKKKLLFVKKGHRWLSRRCRLLLAGAPYRNQQAGKEALLCGFDTPRKSVRSYSTTTKNKNLFNLSRSDCHLQDKTAINSSTPCKTSTFPQNAKGDSHFLAKFLFSFKNSVRSVFSVVKFLTSCPFVPFVVKKRAAKP